MIILMSIKKGFFKRCTLKKEKYRCFFGNECIITPKNRNRCKSCRYQKCLEVNMSIQGNNKLKSNIVSL